MATMPPPTSGQSVEPGSCVIICSRNRPALLRDAVHSVLAMTRLPQELVVVDQSDEPHPELVGGRVDHLVELRYLWSPARGLSKARNLGVRASTAGIVGFLDDDTLADPRWLEVAASVLHRGGSRQVVTGRVEPGPPEVPGAWAPSTISDLDGRSYRGLLRKDVLSAGNMVVYRSAFEDVGPFDEHLGAGTALPSAEDNDFGYRLLSAGYVIDYCPDAVVVHRAWRREEVRPVLKYDYGRGQGAFYAKYALRRDWFMLRRLGIDTVRHIVRAFVRLRRRDFLGARADLAYTRGLLAGALARARTAS